MCAGECVFVQETWVLKSRLCVYACVYVCMHKHVHACACLHMHMSACEYARAHQHAWVHEFSSVRMCVHACVIVHVQQININFHIH